MSATIDANILVYASDVESQVHRQARTFLEEVTRGPDLVYVFWPVLMSYLRIVTHPSIFDKPLQPERALASIDSLLARPHVRTPGEDEAFWHVYRATVEDLPVRGDLVPDAHVVALMRAHGAGTIWTRDRDFRKFSRILARDPFE